MRPQSMVTTTILRNNGGALDHSRSSRKGKICAGFIVRLGSLYKWVYKMKSYKGESSWGGFKEEKGWLGKASPLPWSPTSLSLVCFFLRIYY